MRKRTMFAIAPLVVAISLFGLTIVFVEEGLAHSTPAKAWQDAQLDWENGQKGEAVYGFMDAFRITLDNGARHTIARPLVDQMNSLWEEGRISEAYDRCMGAVAILDGWDEEGVVSYDCFSLWIYVNCTLVEGQMVCPP